MMFSKKLKLKKKEETEKERKRRIRKEKRNEKKKEREIMDMLTTDISGLGYKAVKEKVDENRCQ